MVQCIEEFGTKLKATFLERPIHHQSLGKCEIYVRLPWAVNDPGSAVPKPCADAIRPNNWRSRKTGRIEIAFQFRLQRSALDQVVRRAGPTQLCPVFAYSENIVGIGVCDGKSTTRLNRNYGGKVPPSENCPPKSG